MIPFGEWLPDISAFGNPGAREAKNVAPTQDGYEQVKSVETITSALNSACIGAFAVQASDKTNYNYAGSATKLYQLAGGTWTDQSKASGTYAVTSGDYWEFAKWGEKVIAVGGINASTPVPPQIIDVAAVGSSEFADLGGSPPQARHIMVVRDFVVLGNIYEGGNYYPSRVTWSGINNETEWTTNPARQSDYQDIQGNGGWVRGMRGGSYGTIFQERAITRMDYIGPPLIFSFNTSLPGYGTRAKNSLVQFGDTVFYLDNAGFKAVTNAAQVDHIGRNKVDRWFFQNIDENYMDKIVGAVDRRNFRINWIFAAQGNTSGLPNMGLVYDLRTGRWSRYELNLEWIYDSYGEDTTLEQLDTISASIDSLMVSLDSPEWIGGSINLSAFESDHKSGQFSGSPLEAIVETREDQESPARRALVNRVRPEIEGLVGSASIAPGTRQSISDSVSWGTEATEARDGNYPMRVDSRFIRFRVTITGGFERALGVSIVEATPTSFY